jgi:HEAT repeat protein
MQKKRMLLICTTCALLAALAFLTHKFTTVEPSYGGRPLSYWVAILGSSPPPSDEEKAKSAIDHIGADALPFLVKWIQYENPPRWRGTLGNLVYRTHFPFADRLSVWITGGSAGYLAQGARHAFALLGRRATPAFGDLCRLINDTNSRYTATFAAGALGFLGTNALYPLLTVATKAQHPARLAAIRAIGNISDLGAAPLVVSTITNCLDPTNHPNVQRFAIIALGNLKASPEISVPALLSCLNSSNPKLRCASADALGEFCSQAAAAIPALTNALTDANSDVRDKAAIALHRIDPATFTNLPPRAIVVFPLRLHP